MSDVEETLAWEAEQRPRAVAAAVIGGLCTFIGSILYLLAVRDAPDEDDGFISVTEAISARLDGQAPREQSLLVRGLEYLQDNAAQIWAANVLQAIAVVLTIYALLYLFRATKARAPDATTNVARIAALIALVSFPIGAIISDAPLLLADMPANAEEARDVAGNGVRLFGEMLQFFGTFALGLAFVLVALNAMRVGLLTRFMGILGIIVGLLVVIQLDAPQLIRSLWLVLLGALIAGRTARPPAWETGRAQPWPTQQQIREARQQAAAGTNVPPSEPDAPVGEAEAAEAAAEDRPTPVKRKRKKRR